MIKKLKTITRIIILTFLFASLAGGSILAFQGPTKNNEKVNVLIGFHQAPNAPELNLVRGFGGEVYGHFTIVNVLAVRLPSQAIGALSQNQKVKYVELDGHVSALSQTIPWGINRVFGEEAYVFETWEITRGNGVAVAVLDTGIDKNHEDLSLNILGGINTIDGTHWGSDGSGHGTHVAGTIAALDNGIGVVGVGPEIGLYAVKVLNDSGSGTISSVVGGIEWAVEQNIRILNMSLGTGTDYQTLKEACDAAYLSGHLLIASAGNSGNPAGRGDNVGYPAKYSSVIAVAASDSKDKRASFSSTGPDVEFIAPGVGVLSTLPGNNYGSYSGTSMASPHAAGVAALAWAANSGLTNVETREILQQAAEDLGIASNHQGYGLVRADSAVVAAKGIEPVAYDVKVVPGEQSGEGSPGQTMEYVYTVSNTGTESDSYVLEASSLWNSWVSVADILLPAGESIEVIVSHTIPESAENNDSDTGTLTVTSRADNTVFASATFMTVAKVASETGTVSIQPVEWWTIGNNRHLRIMLTLTDEEGSGVSGAAVKAILDHTERGPWTFSGTTNGDGKITFSLNNAPSGEYEIGVDSVDHDILRWDGIQPDNNIYTKK